MKIQNELNSAGSTASEVVEGPRQWASTSCTCKPRGERSSIVSASTWPNHELNLHKEIPTELTQKCTGTWGHY